jgi:hypothetical protein
MWNKLRTNIITSGESQNEKRVIVETKKLSFKTTEENINLQIQYEQ